MYINNDIIKYKERMDDKDKEIKDSQKKIKILLYQVREKNNYIQNLEKMIKNDLNNISSKSSDKDTESQEFDYFSLLKKYTQLKDDFEELKKENNILYENIDSLMREKNDIYKNLIRKNEDYNKLKFEYDGKMNELSLIKKQNEKRKTIIINYRKHENDLNSENNNIKVKLIYLEKENNILKNKISEFEKKYELNLSNPKNMKFDEKNKKNNVTNDIKISKEKELNQRFRDNELNYLDKISKLQNIINKIKNNYLSLEQSNQIKFSILKNENKL